MNDEVARRELRFMRTVATGLLLAMVLLYALARGFRSTQPWLDYVAAFAEAGIAGAVADWFAVTALFRRPLGLPLPHTAVVPENKERIGERLGDFVERHFLPREIVTQRLAQVDFARLLGDWMTEPAHAALAAERLVAVMPRLLAEFDDHSLARFMRAKLTAELESIDIGGLSRDLVGHLAEGNWHRELPGLALREVIGLLVEKRPLLLQKLRDNTGWIWQKLNLDEKALSAAQKALEELAIELEGDPQHEIRAHFDRAISSFIRGAADDIDGETERIKGELIRSAALQDQLIVMWDKLKTRLIADLQAPESGSRRRLELAVRQLGRSIAVDEGVRDGINAIAREAAASLIDSRRREIGRLIPETMRTWDSATMANRLELQVGKDLQYIRINGTLVGGFAGLALHVVQRLAG